MADYYERRVMAIKDIDTMLANEKPQEVIVFKIMAKFGFGSKLVKERVAQFADVAALKHNAEKR
jgi:hypothetical protein